MLITIDVKNESFKNKFLEFIKTLDYVEVKEIKDNIKKKSKNINLVILQECGKILI